MNIGIDKIGFFVPPTALDMETLAVARGVEPAKYTFGQKQEWINRNQLQFICNGC